MSFALDFVMARVHEMSVENTELKRQGVFVLLEETCIILSSHCFFFREYLDDLVQH